MTVALFDPFSGASGDMILGALVDAGLPVQELESALAGLRLDGFRIETEEVDQHAVRGTRLRVLVAEDQPERSWAGIRALIEDSDLHDAVKSKALAVFEALALAEAAVHGVPIDDVHFHEVGAVDSIVDICGAAYGFHALGLEQVYSAPVRTGSGFVNARHGLMPVPAPATAHLLAGAGAPILGLPAGQVDLQVELLTPTGAAILTTLARFDQPVLRPSKVAHGFGSRVLPWPNALRLWIEESPDPQKSSPIQRQDMVVVETNIDDMSPQGYELLTERLFEAGAVDVWLTPVQMKKSRPGAVVSALVHTDQQGSAELILLQNSTTLGVRSFGVARLAADRRMASVTTRYGDVRLKLKILEGHVTSAVPEYDDCAALARQHERPFAEIWTDASRLGDRFVGLPTGSLQDLAAG